VEGVNEVVNTAVTTIPLHLHYSSTGTTIKVTDSETHPSTQQLIAHR
jgi:hypothetical protein